MASETRALRCDNVMGDIDRWVKVMNKNQVNKQAYTPTIINLTIAYLYNADIIYFFPFSVIRHAIVLLVRNPFFLQRPSFVPLVFLYVPLL